MHASCSSCRQLRSVKHAVQVLYVGGGYYIAQNCSGGRQTIQQCAAAPAELSLNTMAWAAGRCTDVLRPIGHVHVCTMQQCCCQQLPCVAVAV